MKISVLISAYNREKELRRCLNSIAAQDCCALDDLQTEAVVVNDGSIDNTDAVIREFKYYDLTYIEHDVRQERVISYSDALNAATGDWIFHMGSDDVVYPGIFNYLKYYIDKFPDQKLFNYGWAVNNKHTQRMTVTPGISFEPYKHFESGLVAAGSFCWHRSISHLIEFPPAKNCYEFADMACIPGYSGSTRVLGNPWGEDYFMFWKLTRENISMHIPLLAVVVNTR